MINIEFVGAGGFSCAHTGLKKMQKCVRPSISSILGEGGGSVFNRFRPCFNFGSPGFVLTFALLVYRLPTTTVNLFTMAPRLTAGELDLITHCLGKNQEPKKIQRVLNAQRQAKRIEILKHTETVKTFENRYENCM